MNLNEEMRCEAYPGLTCSSYNCLESGQCELRNMDNNNDPTLQTNFVVCPAVSTASTASNICQDPQCVATGGCLPAAVDQPVFPGMGAPTPAVAAKGSTTVANSACHWGAYNLGKIGAASLWVGRLNAFASNQSPFNEPYQLLIGANGEPARAETMLVTGNGAAAATVPPSLLITVPNIVINWEDFHVPTLDRRWWETLVAHIATLDGAVGIYCTGGHGRSGTAAAIIATLGGIVHESQDPVEWLRGIYCKDVVESSEQIAYIERMTGRKVTAKPTYAMGYGRWVWDDQVKVATRAIGSVAKDIVKKLDPAKWGDGVMAAKPAVPTLSKSQWKKWRKKNNLAPKRRPDDNETVRVSGHYFAWDAARKQFSWLGSEEEWDGIVDDDGNMKKDLGIR